MSKSLYSMMLSDEVVEAVDRLAFRKGTSRSSLINQILAEYCSCMTPERRIALVFDRVQKLLDGNAELAPVVTPHQPTMLVKTSLAYRYRPTVRYDVRLYPSVSNNAIGELSLSFRTQSGELLQLTEGFFSAWYSCEQLLTSEDRIRPLATYEPGRLTRYIRLPENEMSAEELGAGISAYVEALDGALKAYIGGTLRESELMRTLAELKRRGALI